MGNLKPVIEKLNARKKDGYGVGSSVHGMEMLMYSNLAFYQSGSDIHCIKNRYNGKNGFIHLVDLLGLVIYDFFQDDLIDELTQSAMLNAPIKQELELAIYSILKKHGLNRRKI